MCAGESSRRSAKKHLENKCESGHVYEKTELSIDVEVFRKHNKTESIYVCQSVTYKIEKTTRISDIAEQRTLELLKGRKRVQFGKIVWLEKKFRIS